MWLFVYDMLVNVNVIYYVHVCEQARWARSAGNSAIENLCIIIIKEEKDPPPPKKKKKKKKKKKRNKRKGGPIRLYQGGFLRRGMLTDDIKKISQFSVAVPYWGH